jgi:hypothetical protein
VRLESERAGGIGESVRGKSELRESKEEKGVRGSSENERGRRVVA